MTTTKEQGVWDLDEVYNKLNVGGIWVYNEQHSAWSWGEQDFGELGVNTAGTRYSSPKQVGTDTTWSSFGNRGFGGPPGKSSSLWIKSDGTAWSAGSNAYGVLGLNQGGNPYGVKYSSPVQIGTDTTWKTATGISKDAKVAIKTDGTMWVWGRNYYGSLAQGYSGTQVDPNYGYRSSPVQIPGSTWENVQAGVDTNETSTLATKSDGTLWGWGRNDDGALGDNSNTARSSPVQIPSPGPGTTTWKTERGKFSSGATCGYAINTDNELYVWGDNDYGALGLNQGPSQLSHISSPVQLPGSWSYIEGGRDSSFGIKTDGTAWSWGSNSNGRLGLNENGASDTLNYSSPVQLPGDWTKFVAGPYCTFGFKGTDLYAWGPNSNGILGQGPPTSTQYSSPVQIPGAWNDICQAGEAVWATKIEPAS